MPIRWSGYRLVSTRGAGSSFAGAQGDPYASIDGSLNAPAGPVQFPNMLIVNNAGLQTYGILLMVRPPWKVAGVDYAVSIDRSVYPTDASLKDPFNGNGLGGTLHPQLAALGFGYVSATVSLDSNSNNITIDGWDFSLNGGVACYPGGNNTTTSNCKFEVGSNSSSMDSQWGCAGSGNLLTKCFFEDNGIVRGGAATQGTITPSGQFEVSYCQIQNSCSELFVIGPQSGTCLFHYNVIRNGGANATTTGLHGDWNQFGSDGTDILGPLHFEFNLCLQDSPASSSPSQGLTYSPTGPVNQSYFNNNTALIKLGSYVNGFVGIDPTWQLLTQIENNYVIICPSGGTANAPGFGQNNSSTGPTAGPSGSGLLFVVPGGSGPYSGTYTESGNIDMVTGLTVT